MKDLGGCTKKGEVFWRWEDQQVALLLLKGWLQESTPDNINVFADKRSIVKGSSGIGKSVLLCVMAFYLVLKCDKKVLMYRQLSFRKCLLYMAHEGDKVVYFSVESCIGSEASSIYEDLISLHGSSSVWLLLDGFRYEHILENMQGFKMLTMAQQVDLRPSEHDDTYSCLLSAWKKQNVFALGKEIDNFDDDEMARRFYYSGGSVREFVRESTEEIEDAMRSAIRRVENPSELMLPAHGNDGLSRTFVASNKPGESGFLFLVMADLWEQVVDSEYAVLSFSVRFQSEYLFRIHKWARHFGHDTLAESAFKLYVHRLACENSLHLFVIDAFESTNNEAPRLTRLCVANGSRCAVEQQMIMNST